MFEKVEEYPVDPIMIGADLFAQDPREDKLNLTVGVYEDENGNTPILEAVKTAERRLADTQGTKAYTALTGDVEYCTTLGETIFGADVYTIFNMTEISSPIVSEPNPTRRGTCGKARPGVDVRLVDENDCEVPTGEIGEMIVRTDRPWGMNSGYYKRPDATAEAWRNGWFHTGDCFRQDEEGYFYFVDRMKDVIVSGGGRSVTLKSVPFV